MKVKGFIQSWAIRLVIASLLLAPFLGSAGNLALAAGNDTGAVYILTNSASDNEVLVFTRSNDGSLSSAGSVSTRGLGTGEGLGSQGALSLSDNGRWLFVVNAGSDEISSFRVLPGRLKFVDKVASGGDMPISLDASGNLLYVLNAGGAGNIAGFRIDRRGHLHPIRNSIRPLSGSGVGPAQIAFSPDGRALVVTEKGTNLIDVYLVLVNRAFGPISYDSAGETPFGFAFTKSGTLIVSEAFGGAADASTVSSYDLSFRGLEVISPAVATHQTAACWIAVTGNGKYAYTTNAGSGSISGYQISKDGHLSLLDADGRTGVTGDGSTPLDMAVSKDSHYLYALAAGTPAIVAFRVNANGSLASLDSYPVPAGSVGLAGK